METIDNRRDFKNAFKCHKCPGNSTETGCPMWWEVLETNMQSGEERLRKGCGYTMQQTFLIEVLKASNRPAAAIESMRNEIVNSIALGMSEGVQKMLTLKPDTLRLHNTGPDLFSLRGGNSDD